jgi:uncharacterized protein with NRDE domain
MCLILLSFKMHSRYPVVLAANRDEFYERPSMPVAPWRDNPDILAGRDLKDGGTWLGMTKGGRIAALTNYRDPASVKDHAPSRGELVRDYLYGEECPAAYLEQIAAKADQYNGFSLIFGDTSHLYCFSNRGCLMELSPGLYGLSNHLLDTPWPKVERGKAALAALLAGSEYPDVKEILGILSNREKPDDNLLPETGVGLEWERILSSIFIASPVYGTRSSTVLMVDRRHRVVLVEKVFNTHPDPWMTAKFEFEIHQTDKF